MGERNGGDRPKKSWRELDAMRDRGGPRQSGDRAPPAALDSQARSSKQYRAALDAAFEKGEVGKLAEKMQGRPAPMTRTAEPTPPAAPTSTAAPEPVPAAPATIDTRIAARKKIVEALGRDEITRAVDRYVKQFGSLPSEFEVLEQALEHLQAARVAATLSALRELLAREKPRRSRSLAGKLRLIEETSDHDELRVTAAEVRAKLG